MPFRFSLQQMFLLFVLVGLFGGYFTSAMSRPYEFKVRNIAISPDGNRTVCSGNDGIHIVDLNTGGSRQLQTGNLIDSFNRRSENLAFIDESTLVFTRSNLINGGLELVHYSIPENEIVRQVALVPATNNGSIEFGDRILIYRKSASNSADISYYDLQTATRIPVRPQTDVTSVNFCSTSRDGRFAVQAVVVDGKKMNQILDLKTRQVTDRWMEMYASELYFTEDAQRMLVRTEDDAFRLVETSTREVIATISVSDPDKFDLTGAKIRLSADGRQFLIQPDSPDRWLVRVDPVSGQVLEEKILPDGVSSVSGVCFSIDSKRMYQPARSTDGGVSILDLERDSMTTIGRFPRILLTVLFCAGFIAWPVFWGWMQRRASRNDKRQKKSAADFANSGPTDPFSDSVPDLTRTQTADPLADSVTIHPVKQESDESFFGGAVSDADLPPPETLLERDIRTSLISVHVMMIVGGIIAILIAVLPAFLSYSRVMPISGSGFYVLALIWSSFGLLTGVISVACGVGKSRNLLRTIATFQILNLINCDAINGVLGIIETIILNMASLRRFLDGR